MNAFADAFIGPSLILNTFIKTEYVKVVQRCVDKGLRRTLCFKMRQIIFLYIHNDLLLRFLYHIFVISMGKTCLFVWLSSLFYKKVILDFKERVIVKWQIWQRVWYLPKFCYQMCTILHNALIHEYFCMLIRGPFYYHGLIQIPAGINDYITIKCGKK